MLEKTRGIFLHAVKYSETSLIATIYTEVYGRQSFIINGVHSKSSPVKASAFQPLYLLDLEIYYKAGKDIFIALDAASSEFFNSKEKVYHFHKSTGEKLSTEKMVDFWKSWVKKSSVSSIKSSPP